MQLRIATLLLVLLTVSFFIFHKCSMDNEKPRFLDTIEPSKFHETRIAHNEFLILMDQGDEKYLSDVLIEFDLKMLSPLGEWVHVAKGDANDMQQILPLSSLKAQENVALLKKIEAHPAVHSAHLNYIQNIDSLFSCAPTMDKKQFERTNDGDVIPNDPYFRYQWHLSKTSGIDLPGAWSITTGNPRMVIALVDRNFEFSDHDYSPDHCKSRRYYFENVLQYFSQTMPLLPYDDGHHGSYVLSVVAPCSDNALGLVGIDWRAQVFAVDTKSDASLSARMFGVLWALGFDVCSQSIAKCAPSARVQKNMHAANVINASFGFTGAFLTDPPYGPVLDVIGHVNRHGGIVVASVGNEASLADRRLPGAGGGVISVGASNEEKHSASFSNYGRTVDVLAPGENILSMSNGHFISLNGTSFSSPIVAGVVSLMLAKNPMLSWKHVEYILKKTASPMSCEDYCPPAMEHQSQEHCQNYCCHGEQVICSAGIVDAKKAVTMAAEGIPQVALIDVDDYYLALSENNQQKTKLIVKNWGKKTGLVRMRPTDRHLKITPETITIAPIDENGIPGLKELTVFYDETPKFGIVSSLILEVANIDQPHIAHDRIEAIVEIVPDSQPARKNRIFMELLPD